MTDAEKYSYILAIGGMTRAIPALVGMTARKIGTIFRFIRNPKTESVNILKRLVKEYEKTGPGSGWGHATKYMTAADATERLREPRKPQKPDMFKHGQYNKGGLQMIRGGAYKGKKHSYAAGGKVNKLNF